MRNRAFLLLAAALGLQTISLPLLAHHGTAAFDTEHKLTLKATVTDWLWSNPHCLLEFDVKNDDGQVAHWIAETQNPVSMVNLGWSKGSFKVGDEVTITLAPVKNGRPMGRIVRVMLPNGNTLDTENGSAKVPTVPTDRSRPDQSAKH